MPAALEIDREQVRIVAVQIGVREAARQFGLSEETVKSWSKREGWLVQDTENKELVEQATKQLREKQGLPPVAPTAAEILRNYSGTTRLSHAKVAEKVAKSLEIKDADEILVNMPNVLAAGKHAALVHGWQVGQGGTSVRLDLLAGTLEMTSQTAQEGPSDSLEIPE